MNWIEEQGYRLEVSSYPEQHGQLTAWQVTATVSTTYSNAKQLTVDPEASLAGCHAAKHYAVAYCTLKLPYMVKRSWMEPEPELREVTLYHFAACTAQAIAELAELIKPFVEAHKPTDTHPRDNKYG